jgi:hypothetical protein
MIFESITRQIHPLVAFNLNSIGIGFTSLLASSFVFFLFHIYFFNKFKKDAEKLRIENIMSEDIEDKYTHDVASSVLDGDYEKND